MSNLRIWSLAGFPSLDLLFCSGIGSSFSCRLGRPAALAHQAQAQGVFTTACVGNLRVDKHPRKWTAPSGPHRRTHAASIHKKRAQQLVEAHTYDSTGVVQILVQTTAATAAAAAAAAAGGGGRVEARAKHQDA